MKSFNPSLSPYLSLKPVSGDKARKKLKKSLEKQLQTLKSSKVLLSQKSAESTQKLKIKTLQKWYITPFARKQK